MRIFDCIVLDDELDLLEARFREFEDIPGVTHVIAESSVTHQGKPKPLHFQESRYGRFAPWHGRWTHVAVFPEELPDAGPEQRKRALRDYLSHGLSGGDGDIILHGNIDEIPAPDAVRKLAGSDLPVTLEMRLCAYRPGLVHPDAWHGTAACRYQDLPGFTALREGRHDFPVISGAGTRMAMTRWREQEEYPDRKGLHETPLDDSWPRMVHDMPAVFTAGSR
jgi:Glycosyltransferase family 17